MGVQDCFCIQSTSRVLRDTAYCLEYAIGWKAKKLLDADVAHFRSIAVLLVLKNTDLVDREMTAQARVWFILPVHLCEGPFQLRLLP
jgi:hypothetical protein